MSVDTVMAIAGKSSTAAANTANTLRQVLRPKIFKDIPSLVNSAEDVTYFLFLRSE